jgi:molybdopterin molybdotransferase
MITIDEAFDIVMKSASETETEVVSFMDSLGCVLAEDIISDVNMPPFNRSAVDGYACNRNYLGSEMEVLEVIPAGKRPERALGPNQCSKIMTGAEVPEGGDFVFMVEDSEVLPSGKVRYTGTGSKYHISKKGEDVKKGDIVLKKGKLIKPQEIAVLASVGYTTVRVGKVPHIGIISTGDELVEPSDVPGMSQIRNSNAYQLLSQVRRAGGIGHYYGIAPDIESETFNMVSKALNENDIVLLTGGVSMGDFDFVPEVLQKAGVKILFDQINVQPGKPTTFGVHQEALVFGLPGNPVSSFVQFEILVRPVICKMMGYYWEPVTYILPMAVRYERKSPVKFNWLPVFVTPEKEVSPVEYHGSAHITAMPYTDGLVALPVGKNVIEKGELVSVRQI